MRNKSEHFYNSPAPVTQLLARRGHQPPAPQTRAGLAPPDLHTKRDLVDFGRTMKTTFKNLLFEDEGEKLLTRIADKRPKVIGGRQ